MTRIVLVLFAACCCRVSAVCAEEGNRRLGGWVIAGAGGLATVYFADQALGGWSRADDLERQSMDSAFSYSRQLELYERATEEWEAGNGARNQALLSAMVCGAGVMAALRGEVATPDRSGPDGIELDWGVSPRGAFLGLRGAWPCRTPRR